MTAPLKPTTKTIPRVKTASTSAPATTKACLNMPVSFEALVQVSGRDDARRHHSAVDCIVDSRICHATRALVARCLGLVAPDLAVAAGHFNDALAAHARSTDLVPQGMTNREVATTLFLSPKTVDHHLGSINQKRGFRSRTQLAHAMAQNDAMDVGALESDT